MRQRSSGDEDGRGARERPAACTQPAASTSSPSTPTTRPSSWSRMGAKPETNVPNSSVYGPTVRSSPEKTSTSSGGAVLHRRSGLCVPRIVERDAIDSEDDVIALQRHEIEPADVLADALHEGQLLAKSLVVGGVYVGGRRGLGSRPRRDLMAAAARAAPSRRSARVRGVPAVADEPGGVEPATRIAASDASMATS